MKTKDTDAESTKTLLRKRVKRNSLKEFIYSQFNTLSELNLDRLSRYHISQHRKQLAVSSFDYVGTAINISGVYEKEELDLFFEWLQQHSPLLKTTAALDIGANVGNHSLYFSDFFSSVHSFEPNLRTYKILKLNAELAENITCHNMGLSDITTEAKLNLCEDNLGASSVRYANGAGVSVSVKLVQLDEFAEVKERISLMKIDVEGLEFEVINGAKNTIKDNQPFILFEQTDVEIVNGTSRCIELLRSLGYRSFASIEHRPRVSRVRPWYLQDTFHQFKKMFISGYKEIVIHENFDKRNYAFIIAIPGWAAMESSPKAQHGD